MSTFKWLYQSERSSEIQPRQRGQPSEFRIITDSTSRCPSFSPGVADSWSLIYIWFTTLRHPIVDKHQPLSVEIKLDIPRPKDLLITRENTWSGLGTHRYAKLNSRKSPRLREILWSMSQILHHILFISKWSSSIFAMDHCWPRIIIHSRRYMQSWSAKWYTSSIAKRLKLCWSASSIPKSHPTSLQ